MGTFDKLKSFLKSEFEQEVCSADVHSELTRSRRACNESTVDFAYRVKKIAIRGKVDDLSTIHYIVRGLSEYRGDKTKLEAYDRTWPAASSVNSNRGYEYPKNI